MNYQVCSRIVSTAVMLWQCTLNKIKNFYRVMQNTALRSWGDPILIFSAKAG